MATAKRPVLAACLVLALAVGGMVVTPAESAFQSATFAPRGHFLEPAAPTWAWLPLDPPLHGPAGSQPLSPQASSASPLLCLLDTGVDPAHDDLGSERIVAWFDFMNHQLHPYDDSGHGTHVAATAAGRGAAGSPGAAPRAQLAIGKVMDAQGHGTTQAAIDGIRWCVARGATVINISLEENDCDRPHGLAEAVRAATRAGVLLVTTAGNRGSVPCAIHPPGNVAEALTVGALGGSSLDADRVADFSGRGAGVHPLKPDLVAPGVGIRAAAAGTLRGLRAMDGTSMAAPYVAGVAGLLRAAHPGASPATITEALRETARDGGAPGPDTTWGWGAVNPAGALAWLDARDPATRGVPSLEALPVGTS